MNEERLKKITFKTFLDIIGGIGRYINNLDLEVTCQCGYRDRVFSFIRSPKDGINVDNIIVYHTLFGAILEHLYCPRCNSTMIYYDPDEWMIDRL